MANDPNNINGFDEDSLQNEAATDLENTYTQSAKNVGNQSAKFGKKALHKKLGIQSRPLEKKGVKASQKIRNTAAKTTKNITRKAGKMVSNFSAKFFKALGQQFLKLLLSLGWKVLAAIAVVATIAGFAGVIIDNEFSRTNDANYQHLTTTDGNKVMENSLSSQGNVFYNTETKRFELGKGKTPTQANRLYYIYYAVMAEQSRWFVQYAPTGDSNADGSKEHPYFSKVKVDSAHAKYSLDGYLFNANELNKGILSGDDADQATTIDGLFDEKAASAIKKMSLNANLLYLLDSTLHGTSLGTGKDQMFFAEQFIKPVNHDSNYNFKALTQYRKMTTEEQTEYNSVAHGDAIDSANEKSFQSKYSAFTSMVETQNTNRGGTNGTSDASNTTSTTGTGSVSTSGVAWAEGNLPAELKEYVVDPKKLGMGYGSATGWFNPGNQCVMFSSSYFKNFWKLSQSVMVLFGKDSASDWANAVGGKASSTPKDGAIASVPGYTPLEGPYSAGHTFIVSHVFENGDILIIEQNYNGMSGESNGTTNTWDYRMIKKNTYVNNHFTFFTPDKKGSSDSGSSSSDNSSSSNDSDSTPAKKQDMSMSTPNTYKDQISTGKLTAQSRQYDSKYNPTIVSNLYQDQEVHEKVWRTGDFYISSVSGNYGVTDWSKYANALGNSQFTIGQGAITDSDGRSLAANSKANVLGDYKGDRDKITQWSIQNGYNPAFVISVISTLTRSGQVDLQGSKYNFLNQNIEDNSSSKSSSSSSSSSASSSSADYDASYGASEYNKNYTIKTIQDGLTALMTKALENNKDADFNKAIKNVGITNKVDKNKFETFYNSLGTTSNKVKADSGSEAKVYTYSTDSADDPNALGSIEKDGKANDTKLDGQLHYYNKTESVKVSDAAKPNSSNSDHPYAIERTSTGDEKMTTGVWDYGFGTIFKISKVNYSAWEISIDKQGNYHIATTFADWFLHNSTTSSTAKYTLLGVTSPFGTINIGNQMMKDQNSVDAVINKIKNNETLSAQDKQVIDGHKTTEVSAKNEGNFVIADKPVIQNDEVELSDMNGGDYITDYLTHYKTYIPQTTETKLDVVDRWKQMNDANASSQEASDNIANIFNKLVSGDSKSDSSDSDTSNASDLQGDKKKAGQALYDSLIKEGMSSVGAAAIMGNWDTESGWDPTAVNGVFSEPYTVGPLKKAAIAQTPPTAIGVGQWLGNRHLNLMEYAKKKGTNWYDLDTQIQYAFHGENSQVHAVIVKTSETDDLEKATSGFYHAWEMHGGAIQLFDSTATEDGTLPKRIAAAKAAYKAYAKDKKSSDLAKLNNGDGSGSTNSNSSTSSNSNSISSSWGDGRSLISIIRNFLSSISSTVNTLFGGQSNWDPTMFSSTPITNDNLLYTMKNKKKADYYQPNTLNVNGVDAYKWTAYSNPLSDQNALMVLRQFVAELETRDARPVYYDEIYNTFNNYDLNRIVEENYKNQLLSIFKYTGDVKDSAQYSSITNPIFNGVALKDTKISKGFGWVKNGNSIKFNPGITFSNGKTSEVDALKAGKVVYVDNDKDFGTTVVIRSDGNTEQIAYSGLSSSSVKVDQQVQVGDALGKSSSDGKVLVMGISATTDVSSKLPKRPESSIDSDYFDISSMFNINDSNLSKLLKDANGYDTSKISSSEEPKAKDFSKTKEVTFGDYSSSKKQSSAGN